MTQLGISQTGLGNDYPNILLIGKEPVVVFSSSQAKKLDGYRVELKHSKKLNTELKTRVLDAENIIKAQADLVENLKKENTKLYELKTVNDQLVETYKDQNFRLENKVQRLNVTTKVLGVTSVIGIGGLIYFLTK